MRRITINAFVPSLVSGLVLFFVLPSGGGRGGSHAVYLGLFRDQWLNMHKCIFGISGSVFHRVKKRQIPVIRDRIRIMDILFF